jgi:hypothetical protein
VLGTDLILLQCDEGIDAGQALYEWDYARQLPSDRLARSVATAVARLRCMDLIKPPGAAEAIDWAEALAVLELDELTEEGARATLGWAVKTREDLQAVEARVAELLG